MTEEKCGRPTKAGTPCKAPATVWTWMRWDLGIAKACLRHMTGEERAQVDALVAEQSARQAAADAAWEARDPACWSWPGLPDVASWEPDVSSYTDAGSGSAAAARITRSYEDPEERARGAMREWQDGRCAVCGHRDPKLVEDHDHATGLVRGYLCQPCNISEGVSARSSGPFAKYRRQNPASMLGVRVRYYSPLFGYAEPEQPVVYEDIKQHPAYRSPPPWRKGWSSGPRRLRCDRVL